MGNQLPDVVGRRFLGSFPDQFGIAVRSTGPRQLLALVADSGRPAWFRRFRAKFDEDFITIRRGTCTFQPFAFGCCLEPMFGVAAVRPAFRFPNRIGSLAYPLMPGGVAHRSVLLAPIFFPAIDSTRLAYRQRRYLKLIL